MAISDQDIIAQYQRVLGRAPTAAEIQQFQAFGSTGDVNLTAQDIGEIIQGLPEAQESELGRFGAKYQQDLAGSDQRILDLAGKNFTQQFTQNGRGTDSSAYVNAFAGAARDLALSRQSQLAGFYGQGYQGLMGQQQGQSQANRQFGQDSLRRRQDYHYGLENVYRQQNAQQDLLNRQSRQNKTGAGIGLAGAIGGTAIGGALGGLPGARLGGTLGGSFGQGFGSFF